MTWTITVTDLHRLPAFRPRRRVCVRVRGRYRAGRLDSSRDRRQHRPVLVNGQASGRGVRRRPDPAACPASSRDRHRSVPRADSASIPASMIRDGPGHPARRDDPVSTGDRGAHLVPRAGPASSHDLLPRRIRDGSVSTDDRRFPVHADARPRGEAGEDDRPEAGAGASPGAADGRRAAAAPPAADRHLPADRGTIDRGSGVAFRRAAP
jgi:hypothetical protein